MHSVGGMSQQSSIMPLGHRILATEINVYISKATALHKLRELISGKEDPRHHSK